MYTPIVNSDQSDIDDFEYSGVIPQLPVDIGTPVLKPEMRKLRHLVGLALRNLTWDNKTNQIRKSSISERKRRTSISSIEENNSNSNNSPRRSRRLTRDATQMMFNPIIQQALHDITSERLLDTMFAIFIPGKLKPIYISESVDNSINPEFTEIDIARKFHNQTTILISVWGRIDCDCENSMDKIQWKKISTQLIDFSTLIFISKSIDSISIPFPINSLIIYLTDGCYILPNIHQNGKEKRSNSNTNSYPVPTLAFDSIMNIKNLQECINDSEMTIQSIDKSISLKLYSSDFTSIYIQEKNKSQLNQNLIRIQNQTSKEKSRHSLLLQEIENEKKNIASRKLKLAQEKEYQNKANDLLSNQLKNLKDKKQLIQSNIELISIELSRISNHLQEIFPIERNNEEFTFTICELELPDASSASITAKSYDEDEIAAAYGLTTQLLEILASYMGVSLRYPLETCGSKSFIIDPISEIQGVRTFPLWTKGSIYYRFEYGVFLFHKDIEQLANSVSLPIANLRHTLANIKNLLLVLSSPGTRMKVIT